MFKIPTDVENNSVLNINGKLFKYNNGKLEVVITNSPMNVGEVLKDYARKDESSTGDISYGFTSFRQSSGEVSIVDRDGINVIHVEKGTFNYAEGIDNEDNYITTKDTFTGDIIAPETINGWKYIAKDKENILQLKIRHLERNGGCEVTEKSITVN